MCQHNIIKAILLHLLCIAEHNIDEKLLAFLHILEMQDKRL